jgi:LysR family transcriptional activator of nhaA
MYYRVSKAAERSELRHLNYGHLHYFWVVAREGSIARAAEALHITPQTISGQLKNLEADVGEPLFSRVGRGLVLSEKGKVVFGYANDIFAIGSELASVVRGQRPGGPATLAIGIVNSMPKLIAQRLIAPVLCDEGSVRVRCVEEPLERLLGDLALHRLDLVLSDQPHMRGLGLRAYSHRLGESGLSFFARGSDARRFRRHFPLSLANAELLLPLPNTALRRRLDEWFESLGVAPMVVGEFDDSALMKSFAEAGLGLFASPTVIEEEICRMYRVRVVGRVESIRERFYAITPERRLKHDSVALITRVARRDLFGDGSETSA